MAKYPERERFLCGEIRLFVGILECGGGPERRHVKSNQYYTHTYILASRYCSGDSNGLIIILFLVRITFRRQHVLKLKWNVMKTSRCKINFI